jgi:vancomycin resistance protein YoaR
MPEDVKPYNWQPVAITTAAIFFTIIVFSGGFFFVYEKTYRGRIFPGVHLAKMDLGGLDADTANSLIHKKIDAISQNGLVFSYENDKKIIFPIQETANGSDASSELIDFDVDQTVSEALSYGRSKDVFSNYKNRLRSLLFGSSLGMFFSIDSEGLKNSLKIAFSQYESPVINARLTVAGDDFTVSDEKTGIAIDYDDAAIKLEKELRILDNDLIALNAMSVDPKIRKSDLIGLESEARNFLEIAPIKLVYALDGKNEKKSWKVEKKELANWIVSGGTNADGASINVDLDSIKKFLTEKVAPDVNKDVLDAKFIISGGKVNEFRGNRDGISIRLDDTAAKIQKELVEDKKNEITILTETIKSAVKASDANDMGITEIIGTGQSNFSGSPKNRRHNIAVGAAKVNGTLIKPGQEFSMIKTLGRIDGTTGYLPELVIKDNKTKPEFGGGLCQIGTTAFRAALASGLPITARRNHSYRVPYYEPAGTDATIYDPQPDFKFINDTPNYILIQTRISGNNLYFDFWGSKDGRSIYKTKPTIYNIVSPEPAKLIETLDLKPGQKKCTEKAHKGADAYFDYKVTYADGMIKEKRFKSHYVPWREVCLIGVEKLSTPEINKGTIPLSPDAPGSQIAPPVRSDTKVDSPVPESGATTIPDSSASTTKP